MVSADTHGQCKVRRDGGQAWPSGTTPAGRRISGMPTATTRVAPFLYAEGMIMAAAALRTAFMMPYRLAVRHGQGDTKGHGLAVPYHDIQEDEDCPGSADEDCPGSADAVKNIKEEASVSGADGQIVGKNWTAPPSSPLRSNRLG